VPHTLKAFDYRRILPGNNFGQIADYKSAKLATTILPNCWLWFRQISDHVWAKLLTTNLPNCWLQILAKFSTTDISKWVTSPRSWEVSGEIYYKIANMNAASSRMPNMCVPLREGLCRLSVEVWVSCLSLFLALLLKGGDCFGSGWPVNRANRKRASGKGLYRVISAPGLDWAHIRITVPLCHLVFRFFQCIHCHFSTFIIEGLSCYNFKI